MTTEDFRNAPSGDGPLAAQWADKPHRLVYDLCRWVNSLRAALRPFVDCGAMDSIRGPHVGLVVNEADLFAACEVYTTGETEWTDQWPQDEGYFWAFGWPFSNRNLDRPPDLYSLKVQRIGTAGGQPGSLAYTASGAFVYKSEAGPLKFTRALTPHPPTMETNES